MRHITLKRSRLANADGHLAGKVGEKEGDNDRDGASYATVSPGLSNGPPHRHATLLSNWLSSLSFSPSLPHSSQANTHLETVPSVPTFSPLLGIDLMLAYPALSPRALSPPNVTT